MIAITISYEGMVSEQKQKITKAGETYKYKRKRLIIPNTIGKKLKINQQYKITFKPIKEEEVTE